MQKLETLSIRVLQILGIALFILLCVTSVLFTRFFPAAYEAEIPYNQVDFFLLTCLGMGVMGILAVWLGRFLTDKEEKAEKNLKILLAIVLLWTLAAGLLWIGLAKSTPIADQAMVYSSAQRFLEGNYGRLEYGKYLYYYPLQLGLTAWESLILFIFGTDNYQAIQIFNVLGSVLSVYAGYKITRILFSGKRPASASVCRRYAHLSGSKAAPFPRVRLPPFFLPPPANDRGFLSDTGYPRPHISGFSLRPCRPRPPASS